MRISDWSSDVCSSDLRDHLDPVDISPFVAEVPVLPAVLQRLANLPIVYPHFLFEPSHLATFRRCPSAPRKARSQCGRSEARRVGQECVSTSRSRWSPSH